MKTKISFLLFFVFSSFAFSQDEPITIGHKFHIESKILGEDREVWISLPNNYNDSIYTKENYSVCYFFDGDAHFENMVAQSNRLSSGLYASMPNTIMVGILQKDRTHELTPTNMKAPADWKRVDFSKSGGYPDFLNFIQNELKPYIHKKYRTNGYEILVGHSFGGLATTYTFINYPEYFDAYIALDPSIWWDDALLLKQLDATSNLEKFNHKTFFLAKADDVGSGDRHHEAILALNTKLDSLQTKTNLRYQFSFYEGEDHGTVVIPAEYDGLRFIFKGYQLPVKAVMKNPNLLNDHFEEVSKNLGFTVLPSEALIDKLAKVCVRQGSLDQAKTLLYKNTIYYPNSEHAAKRYKDFKSK